MQDNINSPRFQTLQFQGTPWNRWAWSFGINGGIVAVLVVIPVTVAHSVSPQPHVSVVSLIAPQPYKPRRVAPPAKPVRRTTFPAPVPKPAEVKALVLPQAPVPKPLQIAHVEAPKVEAPRPMASPVPVVSLEVPRPVKVGGFGNPDGARDALASSKPSVVPTIGEFDAPSGGGTARGGSARLVASAGFGGVGEGGAGTAPRGAVHGAGFGDYDKTFSQDTGHPLRPAAPAETPVEITYKPKPAYTPEAREKKVEGEVLLEVEFGSNGQIHVLRLVRGLGYGLDENARAAAGQIRFHPGTRNGTPVDLTGTVHIYFELS